MLNDVSLIDDELEIRNMVQTDAGDIADIVQACALPKVPYDTRIILARAELARDLTLVAVDKASGKVIGYTQGLFTFERSFQKEFFKDSAFYDPAGDTLMIMGVSVLPDHRGAGIEKKLVYTLCINEFSKGRKRAVLVCHPLNVHMFERMRFEDQGKTDIRRGGKVWHEMTLSMEKWGIMKCAACGNTSPLSLYDNSRYYCCELCRRKTDPETGMLLVKPSYCYADHDEVFDADDDEVFDDDWDFDSDIDLERIGSGMAVKKVHHHKKETNPNKIIAKYRQKKKAKRIRKSKRKHK